MHDRKILRTIILISVLSFSFVAVDVEAAKTARAQKVDVYKEFQAKIDALEKDLEKEKEITKRYDLFLKTHKDLLDLRKKNPRQAESKELNMSLFLDALAPLPAKKDFKASNCDQYVKEIRSSMKSYAADPKEPFIDKALKVAALICK